MPSPCPYRWKYCLPKSRYRTMLMVKCTFINEGFYQQLVMQERIKISSCRHSRARVCRQGSLIFLSPTVALYVAMKHPRSSNSCLLCCTGEEGVLKSLLEPSMSVWNGLCVALLHYSNSASFSGSDAPFNKSHREVFITSSLPCHLWNLILYITDLHTCGASIVTWLCHSTE